MCYSSTAAETLLERSDPRGITTSILGIERAMMRQRAWARANGISPERRLVILPDGDPLYTAWFLQQKFRVIVEASQRATAISEVLNSDRLTVVRNSPYAYREGSSGLEDAVAAAKAEGAVCCMVFSHVHVMDMSDKALVHGLINRLTSFVDCNGAVVLHYPLGGGVSGARRGNTFPTELLGYLLERKGLRLNFEGHSRQDLDAVEFTETLTKVENNYRERIHQILGCIFGEEVMMRQSVLAWLYELCERGPLESLLFDYRLPLAE